MGPSLGSRNGRGWILPACCVALAVALAACSETDPAPTGPAEPDTVVSSITIFESRTGLPVEAERTLGVLGSTVEVRAEALAADGTLLFRDFDRFSWSSSAPDIAAVHEATCPPNLRRCRLVTGVSEGRATITASSAGVTGAMTVAISDRARPAWSVPIGTGQSHPSVTIGSDGTIYVGTYDPAVDQSVWYAVSAQGSLRWSLELPRTHSSTPAIGDDGTLYIGSMDTGSVGRLIAVGPGGTVRWILQGLSGIRSSAAIGSDGTIYVAGGHHVYAVDPQGEIRWIHETDDRAFVWSSPAIANDGTIYVGGADHYLHAINPDGSSRWKFRTGDVIQSSPSIGADGTVYVGSLDGRVYAVDPGGAERWSVPVDSRGVSSSPSIGPDGTVYVIAGDVVAVDPGGSIRWRYPVGVGGTMVTPILGADGTVYVGVADRVYGIDAQGNLRWEYAIEGRIGVTPAIGADGAIIVASYSGPSGNVYEGTVHAVLETNPAGGFDGAMWPVMRGNRANTGRVGG